jgi:5-formyltetrahydrofolate cyclo-ligase
MTESIVHEKRALRAKVRAARGHLAHAAPDAGLRVRDHLLARLGALGLPVRGQAGSPVIAAYRPMADELDIRPALDALRGLGFGCALPVVVAPGRPLVFRRHEPGMPLKRSAFGIEEPTPDAPEAVPVVALVPVLAFDGEGYRLGQGAGFYDRTLARLDARGGTRLVAVGVGFAGQRVARVPREAHDRPMDWLLTEDGLAPARADR